MHPSLILTFLALSASASASPLPEPPSLDPLTFTPEQFGAVGDGKANDWEPLKSAFAACASADLKPRQRCRILLEKDYLTAPLVISSSYTTLEITGSLAMLPHEEMCKLVNCGDDPSKGDVPGAFISNYAGDCENVVPDGSEDECVRERAPSALLPLPRRCREGGFAQLCSLVLPPNPLFSCPLFLTPSGTRCASLTCS